MLASLYGKQATGSVSIATLFAAGSRAKTRFRAHCLPESPLESEYYVIDPEEYDLAKQIGCKALRDGESVTIGRENNPAQFRLSPGVSRAHIRIERYLDEVGIFDLGSTNGTYVTTPPPKRIDTRTGKIY